MYFNVSQLLMESPGAKRTVEIDDRLALTDQERESHIRGAARLLRSPGGIWVSAVLQTTVFCDCSRCLRWIEQPLQLEIEEEFLPTVDVSTGAAVHHGAEEAESFYLDNTHILDLREALRQYAALNLPMKPVCREECAGICPSCGADRNDSRCECDQGNRDSRWGPLLDLATAAQDGS